MTNYREILRLFSQGISQRSIAVSKRPPPSTPEHRCKGKRCRT
ncbi:hypothetical protein [Desulfosporosinus sp. SB140]